MATLPKVCKPGNFKLHNTIHSKFFGCKSLLELNLLGILSFCKTGLEDTLDCRYFSVRGHLPLLQEDIATHMCDFAGMRRRDYLLHVTSLWKTHDSYL